MTLKTDLDIEIKSKSWLNLKDPDIKISQIINSLFENAILASYFNKNTIIAIAISLVSDYQIKKINQQFRQKNKATNILSFPNIDHGKLATNSFKDLSKNQKYLQLGDIVISFERIEIEARTQNKNFNHHLTHLILHSILHLIGFDHENDQQAQEMENLEIKILKTLKINNPYQ